MSGYEVLKAAFDRKDWPAVRAEATDLRRTGLSDAHWCDAMVYWGRACLYERDFSSAASILMKVVAEPAAPPSVLYFLARAYHLDGALLTARTFYDAYGEEEERPRESFFAEAAELYNALAFGARGNVERPSPAEARVFMAKSDRLMVEARARASSPRPWLRVAEKIAFDRRDEAMIEDVIENAKHEGLSTGFRAIVLKSTLRRAYRLGFHSLIVRQREAWQAIPAEYSEIEQRLGARPPDALPPEVVCVDLAAVLPVGAPIEKARILSPKILYADLLIIATGPVAGPQMTQIRADLPGLAPTLAGFRYEGDTPDEIACVVVRASAFSEWVAKSGTTAWPVRIEALMAECVKRFKLAPRLGVPAVSPLMRSDTSRPKRALLLSRTGHVIRGGGERFLRGAADIYAARGYEVLLAGATGATSPKFVEQDAVPHACWELPDTEEGLRAFLIEHEIGLLHTMSGFAALARAAARHLNVTLVYGVHHWRDFLAPSQHDMGAFNDLGERDAVSVDLDFGQLLNAADMVYANSDFTREMLQFGCRFCPPVVPSSSFDGAAEGGGEQQSVARRDGHILMVNARPDKGWLLFLDLAASMPSRTFVAYANQSSISKVALDVYRRGMKNVELRSRTDSLQELFDGAALVLVPSFEFVETFGRIPVEAGNFGVPSLMADSGHLSSFGLTQGLPEIAGGADVLPYDTATWLRRIEEILSDDDEYTALVERAHERASRWSSAAFEGALGLLADEIAGPRILVVAGAGVGNILHVTPMIEKLVEHYGVRVDVLLHADFEGVLGLLHNPRLTRNVYTDESRVGDRAYDVVFVTNSVTPPNRFYPAREVHYSRDYVAFNPAEDVHEAVANLAFLAEAISADIRPGDEKRYYVGTAQWAPSAQTSPDRPKRVVFHGGSKGGIWVAKRWPYFTELGTALQALGCEVISVGIDPEYVPGCIDYTDFDFETMTQAMAAADLVVSNDSGVMNIANALGVPTIALFGPTNPITRGPLNAATKVFLAPTECAPCERTENDRLKDGTCRCIRFIGLDEVLASAKEILAGEPAALPPTDEEPA
ncbi:MAG: glycosyltransferase family 9 protein [Pseudomonadota bacterium]